jgi:hypothetical protein
MLLGPLGGLGASLGIERRDVAAGVVMRADLRHELRSLSRRLMPTRRR